MICSGSVKPIIKWIVLYKFVFVFSLVKNDESLRCKTWLVMVAYVIMRESS